MSNPLNPYGKAADAYSNTAAETDPPPLARRTDTLIRRVEPVGDDLESVYAYLHERARGAGR